VVDARRRFHDSFDLVVCGLALAHVAALSAAVAQLARVLRREGTRSSEHGVGIKANEEFALVPSTLQRATGGGPAA
jgi:ubiquinone/menaquinone biosynthesis C-methylase UbiE